MIERTLGQWFVMLATDRELVDIGSGSTRNVAIHRAVRSLEGALDYLQGAPPEGMGPCRP